MPTQRDGTPVSVLARQLRILDAFDAGTVFLSLSEIAERSGLPMTTTHRLVAELVEERMLERLSDRSYQLGLRLWELAARTPRAMGLREIAAPMVQFVQGQVRQHTQLGVEGGYDVVYLDRASAPNAVVNATIVGGRISLGPRLSATSCCRISPEHSWRRSLRLGSGGIPIRHPKISMSWLVLLIGRESSDIP